MAKSESPLVQAATEFDEALTLYARLGDLFLKTPLTSLKHLERANQTLGELADCEQRLQDTGKKLIEALTAARQKQEMLSQEVISQAPMLKERNTQLRDLMTRMGTLAADVQSVNALVTNKNGDQAQAAQEPDTGEVSAKVLELSQRAEDLATSAREVDFAELADQAHSLHQRLKAIGTKLGKATGN
jgi:septal ring factor EnvC (AmiA/AmiB activator)